MVWLTRAGYGRLEQRSVELTRRREELLAELGEQAARDPDLPENPIWKQLQVEFRFTLPKQIAQARGDLESAEVIEDSADYAKPHDEVRLGSRVEIVMDGEVESYLVVGPHDVGIFEDAVSYLSPLGQALLGVKVGERRSFSAPTGKKEFLVQLIEKGLG